MVFPTFLNNIESFYFLDIQVPSTYFISLSEKMSYKEIVALLQPKYVSWDTKKNEKKYIFVKSLYSSLWSEIKMKSQINRVSITHIIHLWVYKTICDNW